MVLVIDSGAVAVEPIAAIIEVQPAAGEAFAFGRSQRRCFGAWSASQLAVGHLPLACRQLGFGAAIVEGAFAGMRRSEGSLRPFGRPGFELLNFQQAWTLRVQLAFAYLGPSGQRPQLIELSEVLIGSSITPLPAACVPFSSCRPPFASVSLHWQHVIH